MGPVYVLDKKSSCMGQKPVCSIGILAFPQIIHVTSENRQIARFFMLDLIAHRFCLRFAPVEFTRKNGAMRLMIPKYDRMKKCGVTSYPAVSLTNTRFQCLTSYVHVQCKRESCATQKFSGLVRPSYSAVLLMEKDDVAAT